MELIDDEVLFNPTREEIGKKVLWAINHQYDVLIEKDNKDPLKIQLRVLRRPSL